MFLSLLHVNVGNDPDRERPGRTWLRNLYHVHQRLCMAFPSDQRKTIDGHFLAPYRPDDFPEQRHQADQCLQSVGRSVLNDVHAPRGPQSGFLFRIDLAGRVAIVVLSARKPDWDYAFHNAKHLLAEEPQCGQGVRLEFDSGTKLRFRLLANPVRKVSPRSLDVQGKPFDHRWVGKHVPVPPTDHDLRHWLDRRAEPSGFRVNDLTYLTPGYVYFNKTRDAKRGQRLRSVRYDGVLEVLDAERFRETLIRGIGPAKAFGFGLLSVAPMT